MKRKAPSFVGLLPASEASSRVKSKNRHSDTEHEMLLRRELWRSGLRYRKNVASLPAKPDIVFRAAKVAVFCDGDFWHGRNWTQLRSKLNHGTNASYWLAKIARNIRRDREVAKALEADGWQVIRLWETDIRRDAEAVAVQVKNIVEARLRRRA